MIFLVMFCTATHPYLVESIGEDDTCETLSVADSVPAAIMDAIVFCRDEDSPYEATEEEKACRQHVWIQPFSVE